MRHSLPAIMAERAPKELRHAVRKGDVTTVKRLVTGGKYRNAISNPKVQSTILFASAQVGLRGVCSQRSCAL
eukprot:COSAG01_NODE_694_length_14205_cov_228.163122_3_plen_72_part_00